MTRITTVSFDNATGPQREVLEQARRARGGVLAGISQILAADLQIFGPVMQLYRYLNLRAGSPLPKLQREMLITVVNGIIGGKP